MFTAVDPMIPGLSPEEQAFLDRIRPADAPKYRRDSDFRSPPLLPKDGNVRARIMCAARVHETRTREELRQKAQEAKQPGQRPKPVHRGELGQVALEILRVMLFVLRGAQGLFPSIAWLGKQVGKCPKTVTTALKRLIKVGFLSKYRRRKWMGRQVVQDSNAYVYHMPDGMAELGAATNKPSDGKNYPETKSGLRKKENSGTFGERSSGVDDITPEEYARRKAELEAYLAERAKRWNP